LTVPPLALSDAMVSSRSPSARGAADRDGSRRTRRSELFRAHPFSAVRKNQNEVRRNPLRTKRGHAPASNSRHRVNAQAIPTGGARCPRRCESLRFVLWRSCWAVAHPLRRRSSSCRCARSTGLFGSIPTTSNATAAMSVCSSARARAGAGRSAFANASRSFEPAVGRFAFSRTLLPIVLRRRAHPAVECAQRGLAQRRPSRASGSRATRAPMRRP
jgi:hypothetical protein